LTDSGRFIIEVEYIGNILRDIQFERFYLDRIFYYSLTSLQELFARHGMGVTEVEYIEPHGGSLQIVVRRQDEGVSPTTDVIALLEEERNTLTIPRLLAFRDEVNTQIVAFREMLEDYRARGIRVAGYGAPARVSTPCN